MSTRRQLVITVDTEVDKDPQWRISDPPRFTSVTHAIPRILTPLFDCYGARPTYLLSPEVIEDPACVSALRALDDRAELGTHLHPEFAAPERTLFSASMAGVPTVAVQLGLPLAVEERKLTWLTELHERTFGARPTSFRAGRFGLSLGTLEILAGLGYVVDSSVTPGMVWRFPQGTADFRAWSREPRWIQTARGPILEMPLSIEGGRLARRLAGLPPIVRRPLARAFGRRGRWTWLRPSWESGSDLIRFAERWTDPVLVAMFHSVELVPGASPYARDVAGVDRIVGSLEKLISGWRAAGNGFCTLTEAAESLRARRDA